MTKNIFISDRFHWGTHVPLTVSVRHPNHLELSSMPKPGLFQGWKRSIATTQPQHEKMLTERAAAEKQMHVIDWKTPARSAAAATCYIVHHASSHSCDGWGIKCITWTKHRRKCLRVHICHFVLVSVMKAEGKNASQIHQTRILIRF